MPREIRFRAWNADLEIMIPGHCNMMIDTSDGMIYLHKEDEYTKLIPLEYIGMIDDNGESVCEGDIVKYTDDDGSKMIGEVTMVKYQWGLKNEDAFRGFTHQFGMNTRHEIIGNIYENPELLK